MRDLTPITRDHTGGQGNPSARPWASRVGAHADRRTLSHRSASPDFARESRCAQGFTSILREEPAPCWAGWVRFAPFGPRESEPTWKPRPGRGWGWVLCSPLRNLPLSPALLRALLEQPIAATLPRAAMQPAGECSHPSQPHAELARESGSQRRPRSLKSSSGFCAPCSCGCRAQAHSGARGAGEPLGRTGSRAPGMETQPRGVPEAREPGSRRGQDQEARRGEGGRRGKGREEKGLWSRDRGDVGGEGEGLEGSSESSLNSWGGRRRLWSVTIDW